MRQAEVEEALRAWRQAHPAASWEEIEDEVARQVAQLHAQGMAALTMGGEPGEGPGPDTPPACPACAGAMRPCGQRTRTRLTRTGRTVPLERAYYVCPACGAGLFPPG